MNFFKLYFKFLHIVSKILLFNHLILENANKREKSYISSGEYEILKIYENNLIQLMESCPTDKLNEILAEINKQTVKKDNVEKIKSDKNK